MQETTANVPSALILTINGVIADFGSESLRDKSGSLIDLRPQAFTVFRYMSENANRLVTKDELMQAVWPGVVVTDDSLVQCIHEIRCALGDEKHAVLKTVPKRGYRLNLATKAAPGASASNSPGRFTHIAITPALIAGIAALALIGIGVVYGFMQWRDQTGGLLLPEKPSIAELASSRDMPRIAVLPFDDMSAGADRGYLSDAVAEGIITELAQSKTYAVIARNSSFRYRGQPIDVRQIGGELGVDYLLEGSQQKIGDRLKVTAQLLNAHDGSHVWANTYNREIGDLFVVQEEIIRTLADRVGRRIERPLPKSDATRVGALHYYLMGLAAIQKDFSAAGNELLRQFSLMAIEADPNSQFGYIGLAWSYRNDANFGWHEQEHDHDEALKLAAENAERAILLAPDDAEAHCIRAKIYNETGEIDQGIAQYDQAIALNPSNSEFLVGSTDSLLYVGRTDEAIDRIKRAMGIDPFYLDWFNWQMGWALWERNDCRAALAAMRKMSRIPAGAQKMLAAIHACLGNERAAKEALAVFLQNSPGDTISKERNKWGKMWTAPGSLDRWIEHMRIAGLPE